MAADTPLLQIGGVERIRKISQTRGKDCIYFWLAG